MHPGGAYSSPLDTGAAAAAEVEVVGGGGGCGGRGCGGRGCGGYGGWGGCGGCCGWGGYGMAGAWLRLRLLFVMGRLRATARRGHSLMLLPGAGRGRV